MNRHKLKLQRLALIIGFLLLPFYLNAQSVVITEDVVVDTPDESALREVTPRLCHWAGLS